MVMKSHISTGGVIFSVLVSHFYGSSTKLRECNVFSCVCVCVCQFVHRGVPM